MRKFYLASAMLLGLAACGASSNGLLVSPSAEAVGGNLFVETLEDGGQVLVLDGEITPDTSYVFQSLAEYTEIDGLVIAQSPGGDLLASHQIGRTIAAEKINTAVLFSCISACVDVFIAGRERSIAAEAELGLHAAEDREFGLSVDRPYWRRFGFGAVNEAAYKVPFDDIWIITAERAMELRLATEILR
ncbi:MAG: hypothetical protein HKP37_00840 [Boseongicola sp.]|nr:hypothetical protein [Boseongicola sp.]